MNVKLFSETQFQMMIVNHDADRTIQTFVGTIPDNYRNEINNTYMQNS
jgi:hypothetical protein